MGNFTSKFADRKIGPKFSEAVNQDLGVMQFKPRLYENEINFDRLRLYRLNRVIEQLQKHDVGACILFDPINVRYEFIYDARISSFCFYQHRGQSNFI